MTALRGLWPSATRPPARHPCPCAALRFPAHLCAACTPNWAARGAGQRRQHRRPLARRRRSAASSAATRPAPTPPLSRPPSRTPQVTFIRDGKERTCEVGPNDYMLDAADANRIEVGARRKRVPGYWRRNPGSGAGCRPGGKAAPVLQPATAAAGCWHPACVCMSCARHRPPRRPAAPRPPSQLNASCRGGVCGTCVSKLVSGTVDNEWLEVLDDGNVLSKEQIAVGAMVHWGLGT